LPENGHGSAVSVAVQRAIRVLLACQDQAGWWPDRADSDASRAAEELLARWFLHAGDAPGRDAAELIRSGQREDGSWAGAEPGATADLSASVLCYLALALAGDSPDAYHMAAAAGWIRDAGGIDAADVAARAWLALLGVTAWADVPVPAPEDLRFLGRDTPAGSRVVAVTLAILGAVQPVCEAGVEVADLRASPCRAVPGGSRGPATALSAVRSAARPAALRWCGSWLAGWREHGADRDGLRPVWPLSLVALHVIGCPADGPAAAPRLAPVAQTALAVDALRAAGMPADHPAIAAAGRWLLRRRIEAPAFGASARGEVAPCGWSFCPDGYPRPADTALVLRTVTGIEPAGSPAMANVTRWLAATQGRDGSWGGSAAVAGYCVRALATSPAGDPATSLAIRRGIVWLLRAQRPSGAWPGRGGTGDLLATCAVLPALRSAGVRAGKPSITGGVRWLLGQQNADGGWHLGAVAGPPGAGDSDPVGTSLVLSALLAAAGTGAVGAATRSAASWLVRAQWADGRWAGPPGAWGGSPSGSPDGILLPLAALGQYVAGAGVHDARAQPFCPAISQSAFSVRQEKSPIIGYRPRH
jgi:squalene-hopene/tetraprenyl-beta-curcumene cyclase